MMANKGSGCKQFCDRNDKNEISQKENNYETELDNRTFFDGVGTSLVAVSAHCLQEKARFFKRVEA